MNLYRVCDRNFDWCCYVFETSPRIAKVKVAKEFEQDYINMRCQTLRRGVNVLMPMVVYSEYAEGYDMVLKCGYHYTNEKDVL